MKNFTKVLFLCLMVCVVLPSCTTSKLDSENLQMMYEKRINHTSVFNRLFFNDRTKKKKVYENVAIFLNEDDVEGDFVVVAYGSYRPFTIPLLRPEGRSLRHNFLYKAAKMANDNGCNGVLIDTKNHFRCIRYSLDGASASGQTPQQDKKRKKASYIGGNDELKSEASDSKNQPKSKKDKTKKNKDKKKSEWDLDSPWDY